MLRSASLLLNALCATPIPTRQTVTTMKNPWTKKNPLMSMWLSGANKVAGTARGQATAAVKREATRATRNAGADATKQVLDFWSAALGGAAKPKARKRR
jgi:hypothetical protein